MYPRSFLSEEAKIKQRTFLEKKLCEIGEEAIWKSRLPSFIIIIINYQLMTTKKIIYPTSFNLDGFFILFFKHKKYFSDKQCQLWRVQITNFLTSLKNGGRSWCLNFNVKSKNEVDEPRKLTK